MGGRNLTISWIAGVLCVGVVLGLVWLSLPLMPSMAEFIGDGLRGLLG